MAEAMGGSSEPAGRQSGAMVKSTKLKARLAGFEPWLQSY